MTRSITTAAALVLAMVWLAPAPAAAQEPPPRIGPYVIDVHGNVPLFPNDAQQLATSRSLALAELPGAGLGGDIGIHLYLFRWRAVTFGIGGAAMLGRARFTPPATTAADVTLRPTTERFLTASPQLSFNFGTGNGWSYISGGIGASNWSVHPVGEEPSPADLERLRTINYGGGARWFAKKHVAFSLDVRFYAIDPGTPFGSLGGGPRTTLTVIGAGVSVR